MRGSIKGSCIGDDLRSMRSEKVGSKASISSSVVNLRRRQHLRSALVEKLLAKYYPGMANSKTEALINKEVDDLIDKGHVTEQDLRDAEARIRKQSNAEIAVIATSPFTSVLANKCAEKDEWAQLNSAQAFRGLMQEKQGKDMIKKRQEEFKSALAAQIGQVEARRAAEQQEKLAEAERLRADANQYKIEQEQKDREHARKIAKIKSERDAFNACRKKMLAEAEAAVRNEQNAAMEKLRHIQLEEARKRREEKQMSLEKMAMWKQDNEKSLEEKERQKHIEMQRDQELIVKARLAVEEQERKRLIAMEILKAKMQAKEAMGEALGADRQAQMRADEERMLRSQRELDEKMQREINAKKEAAEKMKTSMRKSLDKQIHDKKTREERLKAENEKQARFEAERAVQLMRQAEQKDAERAEMMKQYRLELEDQVRADMRLRPGEKKTYD